MISQKQYEDYRKKTIREISDVLPEIEKIQKDEDIAYNNNEAVNSLKAALLALEKNTLPISFFSDFQNGKSTTALAMTDGHAIIPCGKQGGGIRTSSLPIYIRDTKFGESIQIHLYDKEILLEQILAACRSSLPEETDVSSFDLDNEDTIKILKDAVNREIGLVCSEIGYTASKLDLLHRAILILHFYGCESYKKLVAGKYNTKSKIRPFIAFPTDLPSRWLKLKEYGFDIVNQLWTDGKPIFGEEENLHVFIDYIEIPIRSKFMEETGTAVIDCPGIMASEEDTLRALEAANRAALVLFVIDASKELSSHDKDMLVQLKKAGIANKTIFLVNFRDIPEQIKEVGIEQNILAQLETYGYTEEQHKKLFYYNAKLALLAEQGNLILNHNLDKETEITIRNDIYKPTNTEKQNNDESVPEKSIEDVWKECVLNVLCQVYKNQNKELYSSIETVGLTRENVEKVQAASNWRNLINELKDYLVKNRFKGILCDMGLVPAEKVLSEIDNNLKVQEESVNLDIEKTEQMFAEAKDKLEQYDNNIKPILKRYFSEDMDRIIAEDYYEKVYCQIVSDEEMLNNMASDIEKSCNAWGQVCNGVKKLINFGAGLFGKDPVFEENPAIGDIIEGYIKKEISLLSNNWIVNFKDSIVCKQVIINKIDGLNDDLITEWKKLEINDNDLLDDTRKILENNILKDNIDVLLNFESFGKISVSLISLLPALYVFLFTNMILGIIQLFTGSKAMRNEIKNKIKTELFGSVNSKKQDLVSKIIVGKSNNGIMSIRLTLIEHYENVINQARKQISDDYQIIKKELEKNKTERETVCTKINQFRTEILIPKLKNIQSYLEELKDNM